MGVDGECQDILGSFLGLKPLIPGYDFGIMLRILLLYRIFII
jgi:hypothetical protein